MMALRRILTASILFGSGVAWSGCIGELSTAEPLDEQNGPNGVASGGTDAETPALSGGGGGNHAGKSGSGGNSSSSGHGDEGGDELLPPNSEPLVFPARGITLSEIAVYQGVKRPLMKDGVKASSDVSLVSDREALLRIFVELSSDYDGQEVETRLYVNGETNPRAVSQTLQESRDDDLLSTINFPLSKADMVDGLQIRTELVQREEWSGTGEVRYPSNGAETFSAKKGGTLRLVVVPIAYSADGIELLPDTSSTQLEMIRQQFVSEYPISDVSTTMHQVMSWSSKVSADGSGWNNLLDALADLREQDGADSDEYYYGMFTPKSSMDAYCGGGCVTGLGMVSGAGASYSRAAVGIGFKGAVAGQTAVHEVGHNHGRSHSPCGGANGADPSYPHSGGDIGAWGYDILTGELFAPTAYSDFMGYCDPSWVSDYTFEALLERSSVVNEAKVVIPEAQKDRLYERVRISGDGSAEQLPPIRLRTPPGMDALPITVDDAAGSNAVEATFIPYDHVEGGVYFWPARGKSKRALRSLTTGRTSYQVKQVPLPKLVRIH